MSGTADIIKWRSIAIFIPSTEEYTPLKLFSWYSTWKHISCSFIVLLMDHNIGFSNPHYLFKIIYAPADVSHLWFKTSAAPHIS